MSALLEDPIQSELYFDPLSGAPSTGSVNFRVFEWYTGHPHRCVETRVSSTIGLLEKHTHTDCKLRVMLAPNAPSFGTPDERKAFKTMCDNYDAPSAFSLEYFTSPAYAFGQRRSLVDANAEVAWTRFICKDVIPHQDKGPFKRGEDGASGRQRLSSDNPLWIKNVLYLHVLTKDSSRCVNLFCWGAIQSIEQRIERLARATAWEDAVEEPYLLFALIYEQLFLALDQTAWTLANWFRPLEKPTLDRARSESSGKEWLGPMDFAKLHEIAKHCIYLREAATAAEMEMESIISHLRDPGRNAAPSNSLTHMAISQFRYQLSAFRSTRLRLSSLDKRISNVISLSFNLVTQRDSRNLTHDSNAMKAIALLTLIFLPMTGVASLFDTPFFEVDNERIKVAPSFWIFWVGTLCLTITLVVSWVWWYRYMRLRTARHSEAL